MADSEVKVVAWQPLKEFAKEVFIRAGMPPADAEAEAGALIWANLRAVDSHGVLRIPWYLDNIEKGVMNPKPDIKVIKETPATIFLDADRALGPVVTIKVVDMVVAKAKETGICWALIRNLTHQGALGYYSQMIAEKGMAGIVFVCNPPNMAPFGARVPGVHNSPIAISVPAKRHRPLNLDMATSVVAGGKLWLAVDKNVPIPEGWALDKEGKPTTDPKNVGALLPFGGPKGSGLSMMFECLSSVMAGNPQLEPALFGRETDKSDEGKQKQAIGERLAYVPKHIQNSVVAAIDIGTFTDLESYKEHIDNLIDGIKALPKADGFSEIFVPGEPEERTFTERSKKGIPLPEGTVRNLRAVSEKLGVKLPPGL
jgi:LDH2 family malate/lactate/ureidoglycolate dehydrogenase